MSQMAEPRTKPGQEELGFDPASLKKKYLAERDKRLRADGNEQYRRDQGRRSPTTSTTPMSSPGSRARR